MDGSQWQQSTTERPNGEFCQTCAASPGDQGLFRGPTGPAWHCKGCHAVTSAVLPFDPKVPPEGRDECYAAIETLTVFVPIMATIDRELIYKIVRPYFNAGWSVRDIVYAMDYTPDGQTYVGQGAAWVRGEGRDRTLYRLQRRLWAWRWADRADGDDIMDGAYTSMTTAMRIRREEIEQHSAIRAVDWANQADKHEWRPTAARERRLGV